MTITSDPGLLQGFELLEQWLAWRETCLAPAPPATDRPGIAYTSQNGLV